MVQGIKFRGAAGVGARCTSNVGTSVLVKEESRALCLPIVPCRSQTLSCDVRIQREVAQ